MTYSSFRDVHNVALWAQLKNVVFSWELFIGALDPINFEWGKLTFLLTIYTLHIKVKK